MHSYPVRTISRIGSAVGNLVDTIICLEGYPMDSRNLIPGKPVSLSPIFDGRQGLDKKVPSQYC